MSYVSFIIIMKIHFLNKKNMAQIILHYFINMLINILSKFIKVRNSANIL